MSGPACQLPAPSAQAAPAAATLAAAANGRGTNAGVVIDLDALAKAITPSLLAGLTQHLESQCISREPSAVACDMDDLKHEQKARLVRAKFSSMADASESSEMPITVQVGMPCLNSADQDQMRAALQAATTKDAASSLLSAVERSIQAISAQLAGAATIPQGTAVLTLTTTRCWPSDVTCQLSERSLSTVQPCLSLKHTERGSVCQGGSNAAAHSGSVGGSLAVGSCEHCPGHAMVAWLIILSAWVSSQVGCPACGL